MIKLTVLLLLISTSNIQAEKVSLEEVRKLYLQAAKQEKQCRQLSSITIPNNSEHISAMKGYRAAATMMMANYVFNPISKISYFRKGRSMLESAIAADSKNVELRFLRFTIQTNAPSFLGYNRNVDADQNYLVRGLPGIKDKALKTMITDYLHDMKTDNDE